MSKCQPTKDDLYALALALTHYTYIPFEERKNHYGEVRLRLRVGNEYFYFLFPDLDSPEPAEPGNGATLEHELALLLARSLLAERSLLLPSEA